MVLITCFLSHKTSSNQFTTFPVCEGQGAVKVSISVSMTTLSDLQGHQIDPVIASLSRLKQNA